jgi:hypothetical protein
MGLAVAQLQFNQIVEFAIEAGQLRPLVAALLEQAQRITCTCPGFISATVQASEDRTRVISQVLWASRQACDAAMRSCEPGEPDVIALLTRHRVRAATFDSYQVMGRIQPRHRAAVSGQTDSCTN